MQWLLDKQELLAGRQVDLKHLSEEELLKIHVFFANCALTLSLIVLLLLISYLFVDSRPGSWRAVEIEAASHRNSNRLFQTFLFEVACSL